MPFLFNFDFNNLVSFSDKEDIFLPKSSDFIFSLEEPFDI